MNIKNLKELNGIKQLLSIKPEIFIIILWAGLSLFVLFYLFNNNNAQKKELNSQSSQIKEKLDITKELEQKQNSYDQFIKSVPESLASDQLTNQISKLAANNNVQIVGFSPAEKKENNFLEAITININVSSESYEYMAKFIKDIELAPYFIRVEKWEGKLQEKFSSKIQKEIPEEKKIIEANIEISSIQFKK